MKKTIKDFRLKGKKVIIRSDLNVPLKEGKILDDTRIQKSLETIDYALEHGAKVIVLSHLGRINSPTDLAKNDLKIVAQRLEELLQRKILFVPKTRGKEVENAVQALTNGQVLLLQNTRYEDLEGNKESNCDSELAKYWAGLGDIFINDAFGTLHRRHASNVGISAYLPSGIGFLVAKELTALDYLFHPDKPFMIILGGAKVKDKIGLIEHLLPQCAKILIGGGMAFSFLQADGYEVGNSLIDKETLGFCEKLLTTYSDKIILPIDVMTSTEFSNHSSRKLKAINEIEFNEIGLDIGPETISLFERYLQEANTILWNGPLGVYEFEKYQQGTKQLLTFINQQSNKAVLAGGDMVAAAKQLNLTTNLYHVSTGGGATLAYLEGQKLPGLETIPEV